MNTMVMDMTRGVDQTRMEQAGQIIRRGGLVAFPTETVYGLGGDALAADSAKKIYAAKGRPSDNPLIVHIADLERLAPITRQVPPAALELASRFWPGPLTMILQKSQRVPSETTGGLDTVAVRMPDHPLALALIRAAGGYIAAPSANTSGRPSPTRAAHVLEDLQGRIEAVIDGGDVGIGLESTIIDLTGPEPVILRPGYITPAMLSGALGRPVEPDPGMLGLKEGERPRAPGMKYRHYAPRAQLRIVEGERERVSAYIAQHAALNSAAGKHTGIMTCREEQALYRETDGQVIVKVLGSFQDEAGIAAHLYAVLREFDALEVDEIYSQSFDTPRMGQAIMNRLMKAAGGCVVSV